MRSMLCFAVALSLAAPAYAQAMNAEEFHRRATALKKKGPLALLSTGEIKALMAEGKAAGEAAGARRRAESAAGRKPRYCPPTGATRMDSDEYMKRLSAIPAAERRAIDMTEATTRIMVAKFPCPA